MDEDLNELLNRAKEILKDEMSEVSHKTWIEPLKIDSITDNNVVLVSDEIFKRNFIDAKFHDLIMNTFSVLLQKNCTLSIICKNTDEETEDIKEDIPQVEEVKVTEVNDEDRDDTVDIGKDLFSNLDNTETYTTYYVYIVKDDDTVEKILTKYDITKEDFENYNDINNIKAGDKVIIPKKCE